MKLHSASLQVIQVTHSSLKNLRALSRTIFISLSDCGATFVMRSKNFTIHQKPKFQKMATQCSMTNSRDQIHSTILKNRLKGTFRGHQSWRALGKCNCGYYS